MSSLQELPPLPPSLSSMLEAASSAEWRHAGVSSRLSPDSIEEAHSQPTYMNVPTYSNVPAPSGRSSSVSSGSRASPANTARSGSVGSSGSRRAGPAAPLPRPSTRRPALEQQLERLRREMGDLRQLDLTLLHQLWSLNDSIEEFKQLVRSPSWDNGYDGSADEEDQHSRGGRHTLASVSERLSAGSSSSLEFGDI